MPAFIDPRVETETSSGRPATRTTRQAEELAQLNLLCSAGRLYDVERWIAAGRPLQVDELRSTPTNEETGGRSPEQVSQHSFE
jgi:hypothetical protein